MADPGGEVVYCTETVARPEDETETLRRQNEALRTENRDILRRRDEISLYLEDLEEKNVEYAQTISNQADELRDRDAQIARLKHRSVNFEAELEGLHRTGKEENARIVQLGAELAATRDAAQNDHETLEALKPMIKDYISENLHQIDNMYDVRVIYDDSHVEVRALEHDLRAAAVEYRHMDALSATFNNVAADHARLRLRLDIVERHFPGTITMEDPQFNTFLTDFRRENNASPPGKNSENSRDSHDSQGSKSSESPKDPESSKNSTDQISSRNSTEQKSSKKPKGSQSSKKPKVDTQGRQKDKRRSASLSDELQGLTEDVTEETEEAVEAAEAVLTTPDTALAPGGFPRSPHRTSAAYGDTDHETVLSALARDIDWRLALPVIAIAVMAFVSGSWYGDYRWSNANGYAPHGRYFHVNRGVLTFLIDVVGGVILWFLGLFCDPLRVYESWAQLAQIDATRLG